jgi:hypothetical protein
MGGIGNLFDRGVILPDEGRICPTKVPRGAKVWRSKGPGGRPGCGSGAKSGQGDVGSTEARPGVMGLLLEPDGAK